MVFSSAVFLLAFLPLVLLVYYAVPFRFKNPLLLLASLFFYAWGEPVYVLIMLFSTVFDYGNGLLLERLDRDGRQHLRRWVLALSVSVNLGLLGFFKYTGFLLDSLCALSGGRLFLPMAHIALPIGISFYTFQTLSYTIDVYRREIPAQHRILDFGMYICLFPQLIAGPIVKYRDVASQLRRREISPSCACAGMFRFVRGLAKKVLLANTFGAFWDEIAAQDSERTAVTALLGAAAYMLQIYFDFSGYSDMAIGIGRMLGFVFPENFDFPYESRSVTEFWRRWHISLGSWFREYLYIPLGGNRRGLPRQIVNLLIVWLLTGLWHGAGWQFAVWGLYFFVLLVVEKVWLLRRLNSASAPVAHLYTLAAVLLSWVIFASGDLGHAGRYLLSLFGANGFADAAAWYYIRRCLPPLLLGAFLSVRYGLRKLRRPVVRLFGANRAFAFKAVLAAVLYILSLLSVIRSSYNPFLYFRF